MELAVVTSKLEKLRVSGKIVNKKLPIARADVLLQTTLRKKS